MSAGILADIEKLVYKKDGFSISIVGAGGKTSLMHCLANHLPELVVCTTSTKLSLEEANFFEKHIVWNENKPELNELFNVEHNLLFTGKPVLVDGIQKLSGLTEEKLILLNQSCKEKHISLIIEADGSKRRPLKAPADWEPVIPSFSDLVIVVVGMAGLMKPLNEKNVFRSQIFATLTGLEIGEPVDMQAILRYLAHTLGGLKGIPEGAKRFILFNLARCETPELVCSKCIEEELRDVYDQFFIENVIFPS